MCYANAINYISENEDTRSTGLSEDECSDIEIDHGRINGAKIQRKCVVYTLRILGTSLYDAIDGKNCRVSLEAALLQMQAKLAPLVSTRTLRRWIHHYYSNGETHDRTLRKHKRKYPSGPYRKGFYNRRSRWEDEDIDCLRWILQYNEQLFLDEVFKELYVLTGKNFSPPTIYRQIRRLGYSCRRIFETAKQIDYVERSAYKLRILEKCLSPEMLITIDETSKGKGDGTRDRMWCRKKVAPCVFRYFGNKMIRYSMLAAADINGFVVPACSLVVCESRETDSDLSHGTIGREWFIL